MQTCILTLGILLAGQIGDSGDTRYPAVNPSGPASGSAAIAQPAAGLQPWAEQPSSVRASGGDRLSPAVPPATDPPPTQIPHRESASAGLTKITKAAELLASLAKPVGTEVLSGAPIKLADAIQNASLRAEQTRQVKRYWEISQAVTNFHLVALEAIQLKAIHEGLSQPGLTAPSQSWQQAREDVAIRSQVAKSAVRAAQLCLQKEMGLENESNLPLPADLPHCGNYETRFAEIFQGRNSSEAQQLSQLLPLLRQELGQHALKTAAARKWYTLVSQQRSPQSDGTQLLKAYEQLALQRRAFVSTAYRYNASIARYTELAVPQNVGSVRLVTMLIQSDDNDDGTWQRSSIQRASAEESVTRNNVSDDRKRTFAGEQRNRTLRVPADASRGERSILVKPSQ